MKHLVLDLRTWLPNSNTGVGIVSQNLALRLPNFLKEFQISAFSSIEHKISLEEVGIKWLGEGCKITSHPANEWFYFYKLPQILRKENASAFLSFENWIPWHSPCPSFTIIHDLSVFQFPEAHSKAFRFLSKTGILISSKNATGIFTVSNFICQELISKQQITPEKLTVLPLGTSKLPSAKWIENFDLPKTPFILGVGLGNPRKNLARLLDAWKIFAKEHSEFTLVLAGNLGTKNTSIIKDSNEKIISTGHIQDSSLQQLYQLSHFLIYPSLYEGLGIPLLDAVQLKKAICCSNIPPFKEILGNQGIFFDPKNPNSIANSMKQCVKAPIVANQNKINKKFNWELACKAVATKIRTNSK